MTKPTTFMRIEKNLLEEIKKRKTSKRESYADVVRRVFRNDLTKQKTTEFCSFCGKIKPVGKPCSCTYGGVFG